MGRDWVRIGVVAAACGAAGPALATKTAIAVSPEVVAGFVLPEDPTLAEVEGPVARPELVLVGYGEPAPGEVAGPNGERWRVVIVPLR